MKNKDGFVRRGPVLAVTAFGLILLFVGFLLGNRMIDLLRIYTENQTKRQALTYASLASEKLQSELDELKLAYATTIHKAQGSEYPAVVLPLLSGPEILMNRNLIYTAITRAKSCVVIIGRKSTVEDMIMNTNEQKRYTSLAERIREVFKLERQ